MSTKKYNPLRILEIDPWLEPVRNEIIERHNRFLSRLKHLELIAGSLDQFAEAYNYFGIHFLSEENCWVYREWAPQAFALFLTGDFNGWSRSAHPLNRLNNGIWEIKLPFEEYKESFIHGSKIKVLINSMLGASYRIPAYSTRVIQDESTKDFSAQLWFPEPFKWKNDRYKIPAHDQLLIYEAHIGMAQENEGIGSYSEFRENVLPRVKNAGYNAIQLMAIQEHPYYGSFGYHVSNFFAPSSRFGTPEELKLLIYEAHKMGIAVIMDIVHSHTVKNINEGLNLFDGSDQQYFHAGPRGEHPLWDSMLFDYGKVEVLQFLLSNVRYWMSEFHFDGFRFDGVGSMLYFHHGDAPIDSVHKYFSEGVEYDAVTYLQLANTLVHNLNDSAVTIAEDVTGMPGLTVPVTDGGLGFDYRLGMGIPDFWIKYLKDLRDEDWSMQEMWHVLNDRLPHVKTVAYCESHDQALVGDKTIAFRLMDKEMYYHMQAGDNDPVIDRGIALHKLIRMFTITLGGNAYLNFMGNEFGHPEWIDFPRQGNEWSYKYARRQWSLVDDTKLKYRYLALFDKAMIQLVKNYRLMNSSLYARLLNIDEENKCIIYERAGLLFLFNFHPERSLPDYQFWVPTGGDYKIILNSDAAEFGGHDRIEADIIYPAISHEESLGYYLKVYFTSRTVLIMQQFEN